MHTLLICRKNVNIEQEISFFIFFYIFRYPKAIEIFEEIARQSMNNNLLKYSVKGILLNAGICQLCRGDAVAITNSLERYQVSFLFSSVLLKTFISQGKTL